jgi:hypothetical protein
MFPSLLAKLGNGTSKGKVFGFRIDRPGVVGARRATSTDIGAWQECLGCPDLDGCYRLSTGTLHLEAALSKL